MAMKFDIDLTPDGAVGAAGRKGKENSNNSLGEKGLSTALAGKLAELHQQGRKSYTDLLSRQLKIERRLAVLVEDAYGLTLKGAGIDAGNTPRARSAGCVGSEDCGDGGCGRRGSGGLIGDGVQGTAEL